MQDRFKYIKDTELKYIGKSKRQRYMFPITSKLSSFSIQPKYEKSCP